MCLISRNLPTSEQIYSQLEYLLKKLNVIAKLYVENKQPKILFVGKFLYISSFQNSNYSISTIQQKKRGLKGGREFFISFLNEYKMFSK